MGLLDFDDTYVAPEQRKANRFRIEATANKSLKKTKTRRGKKKKNKKKIPKMSYKVYMGSAYWKKRKLLYWNKRGKSCAICQKKEGVTLHHKRYDVKYGEEPDDALVALCKFHHHQFHLNFPLKANMVHNTDTYVQEAKKTHQQMISSNIDDISWI